MGHGLGLRLSEPPSIRLEDDTVLQPGRVLCIEPALEYEPGKIVLHVRKGPTAHSSDAEAVGTDCRSYD
ncbi:M24 family metallopeptidase [Mesorhizobium sp. M1005]|uniref:M24 family metallopeptidase n=1 Tax=unclassified Mesorhizobium TaxID=325217 RepID=UPI00333D0B28